MKRSRLRRTTPLKAKKRCKVCGKSLCNHGRKPALRRTPVKQGGAIKPVNRARRAKRFERSYGSEEWVEFIHQLPCDVCGCYGWTVAAHTDTGGMGMKAGPETIAALCGSRYGVKGCHEKLDQYELEEHRPRLKRQAKARYRAWMKRKREPSE